MTILNDRKEMQNIDKSDVYGSVIGLQDQCTHAWKDAGSINIPENYKNAKNIIMSGMGGSGLGARIIESVYGTDLTVPLIRVNDYNLPNFVNSESLVICSSFSGTTEEVVENLKQAINKKSKVVVIASGGALIDIAIKYNFPYYKINPTFNPSKQPRLAIGYSVVGQLVVASKCGLLDFDKNNLNNMISGMSTVLNESKIEISTNQNPAKKIARQVIDKGLIFVGAKHMIGAIHTVKNQTNENSKHFSAMFNIPELNHHLMEGLEFPDLNQKYLAFIFVNSNLYPKRLQKRFNITEEIVNKYKIESFNWRTQSNDSLSQAFEFIQFGGLLNYYLVMLHGVDPAPIPWVDYFKIKLGQPLGQWK